MIQLCVYTMSEKSFMSNFGNIISKFLSSLAFAKDITFPTKRLKNSHYTLIMLLHYLKNDLTRESDFI